MPASHPWEQPLCMYLQQVYLLAVASEGLIYHWSL